MAEFQKSLISKKQEESKTWPVYYIYIYFIPGLDYKLFLELLCTGQCEERTCPGGRISELLFGDLGSSPGLSQVKFANLRKLFCQYGPNRRRKY